MRRHRLITIALVLALAAAIPLAGCTASKPEPPAQTGVTPTEPPAEDGDTDDDVVPPDSDTPDEGDMIVTLFWVSAGENALAVRRTVPKTDAVATAAVTALIAGPTPDELATWPALSSAIPKDTRLLGLSITDSIAKIDLSKEFESGGGTFSMTARLAQVVYTLTEFPTIDAVEFYIEGKRVTEFSSEGIILDGPQRFEDFERLLPIDA